MVNENRLHLIQALGPREDPFAAYYTGTLRGGQQALLFKQNDYSCTYIFRFGADGFLQDVQERDDINWFEDYPAIARWLDGIGITLGPIRVQEFSIREPLIAYLGAGYPRHYDELESLGYDEAKANQMRRDWVEQGNCKLVLGTMERVLGGHGWGE